MKDLVNYKCKCYWLDEEWHKDENVRMPSTFMQCERCKCLEIDDHFEGVHLRESYYDSNGNLINFKIGE